MEKYAPLGVVGEGSYGVVLKCKHRETGRSVAIKKFIDSEDDQNVRKIALREIRVLRKLRHENLVNLLEVFRRRKHLYLVFEFIDHTLLDELENKGSKGLEGEVCRKYVFQILRGLGFCHDNNIIHRDVKPENVLVSKNGIVKLCDFGFARNVCGAGEVYTDYVATRWYRAPELLVGDVAYGKEVDIWAVGCLFAEMMSGEALFPGDSDIDQLFLIAQCLGRLSRRHLSIMSRNSAFSGFQFPKSRGGSTASSNDSVSNITANPSKLAKLDSAGGGHSRVEKSVFTEMFPSWTWEGVEFLTLTLDPEPQLRPSCSTLLRLPYFTHDAFPARFINELNQKLQLEGRLPLPSYSMRKQKRSVLGNLQGGSGNNGVTVGGNQHHHSNNSSTFLQNLKRNPVNQGRHNLSEDQQQQQKPTTLTKSQNIPAPAPSPYKTLSRDSTFLIEKSKLPGGSIISKKTLSQEESKIPSLSRKHSDDSVLRSGTLKASTGSKSTPNINKTFEESGSQYFSQKRYSIQQQQQEQQSPPILQSQSQPRKFSFSFPPPPGVSPSSVGEDNNPPEAGTGSGRLFQPLPVTTLTFSMSPAYPYSLLLSNNSNKSPNASTAPSTFLSVSGYGASHTKQSPSPTQPQKNSSYFPSSNGGGSSSSRLPVSFYQGNSNNKSTLPSSVLGSSMILKNLHEGGGASSSFLPRMQNGGGGNNGRLPFKGELSHEGENTSTTSLRRSKLLGEIHVNNSFEGSKYNNSTRGGGGVGGVKNVRTFTLYGGQ